MKLKQNMIITICIVVAVCLVALVFAYSAYARTLPLSQPAVQPTPVPTPEVIQPTPVPTVITPTPTSVYAYLDYIQSANDKMSRGKRAVENGKLLMVLPLASRSGTPNMSNVIFAAKQNFTSAETLFTGAQEDYSSAMITAPQSQKEALNILITTLNSVKKSVVSFTGSSNSALAGEWFSANDVYNQASLSYQSSMETTNQLLAAMNLIT